MRERLRWLVGGITAVATKELRGRMRGPRAFLSVTFYVSILALFVFMVYMLQRQSAAQAAMFGGQSALASGQVGASIFIVLIGLQTLLVVFLAPASTSGAISLEREKQTLELLSATPVPSLAIVLGKLLAALAFTALLVFGSLPLVAVVFVFGGVAPDDLVRAYLVLLIIGFGFGTVGITLSSLTRRTQAATVLTLVTVLVLTFGSAFGWYFWAQMSWSQDQSLRTGAVDVVNGGGGFVGPIAQPVFVGGKQGVAFGTGGGPIPVPMVIAPAGGASGDTPADSTGSSAPARTPAEPAFRIPKPPEWLLWLNPLVAMADVMCGADTNAYSPSCVLVSVALGQDPSSGSVNGPVPMPMPQPVVIGPGGALIGKPGIVVDPGAAVAVQVTRDRFWPRMAAAWLATSLVLIFVSVRLLRPRSRPTLPRRRRPVEPAP